MIRIMKLTHSKKGLETYYFKPFSNEANQALTQLFEERGLEYKTASKMRIPKGISKSDISTLDVQGSDAVFEELFDFLKRSKEPVTRGKDYEIYHALPSDKNRIRKVPVWKKSKLKLLDKKPVHGNKAETVGHLREDIKRMESE